MKTNSIKTNFIYNTVYQVLLIIVPLITTPYISRKLGADGIGVHAYAYSVAYYFSIFIILGLNNYGNRTIAINRNNKYELRKTFWSIYKMQFCLGVLVLALYVIYCTYFADNKRIAWIMILYLVSCTFDINWAFYGLEKFKVIVTRSIFIKLASTVLIIALINSEKDIWIYSLIVAGSMLISQGILWPFILKSIPYTKTTIRESVFHLKPNVILFITVLANSLFKIMDKIMLGIMTSKEQVGFYESSEKVLAVPIALIISLGAVMLPRMSHMYSHNDTNSEALIEKSLVFATFVSSSMAFGLMTISDVFVPLFYGPGFEVCIVLFHILLPSCVFMGFANVIRTQYLIPKEMDKEYLISTFLGAGVNMTINILLIPQMHVVGAAIGTLAAEIAVCVSQCYFIRKQIKLSKYVFKCIPFLISGVIMWFLIYRFTLDFKNELLVLIAKILIGGLTYLTSLFILELFLKRMKSQYYIPIIQWIHVNRK